MTGFERLTAGELEAFIATNRPILDKLIAAGADGAALRIWRMLDDANKELIRKTVVA